MASEHAWRLRPSGADDLDWLLAAQADAGVRPRIAPWSREEHHAAFGNAGRARRHHRRAGFMEEGVMRECLAGPGGYESLVLMSMLAAEHAALTAGAGT